jgi:nucleoside-diphosphate kinase
MNKFYQKTLVLIKPDAMERNLAGEIIARIQKVGLRIVDCKMIQADENLATEHYPVTDEWLSKVGNNTISDCDKYGVDVKEAMGTDVPIEIGKKVHHWNKAYLMQSPVLAIVFEGIHAVEIVRKLCGPTLPLLAPAGTIRGDYSSASAISENIENAPIRNLMHASGDPEEAKREIELWFGKN